MVTCLLISFALPVQAAKPAGNLAGAQTVAWNLSAAVMPVPPYGSRDIPGSDTASKLIVNQPNGNNIVTMTGVMNGLHPNTVYTVYLSKGYTPYMDTGWSVVGTWILRFNLGGNYDHDIIIDVQSGGTFSGTGGYPASGPPYSITETVTGNINVMTGAIAMHSVYNNGYWYDAVGTIAPNGTMSGTWGNAGQGYGHAWYSTSGNAVKTHTGSTGWPGLFTGTVQPFTFMTDATGAGSWHVNLTDADLPIGGPLYNLSVWINEAGLTMLISGTFQITVG
ncbi:MAG: hypothetical protein ABIG29_01160 [Candidatus Nealsonbacteria bacterium]